MQKDKSTHLLNMQRMADGNGFTDYFDRWPVVFFLLCAT